MGTLASVYWASFAKIGDPNVGGRTQWPRHDSAADEMVDLANTGAVVRPDSLKARLGPHPSSAPAHRATRAIAKVVRAAVGSSIEMGDEKRTFACIFRQPHDGPFGDRKPDLSRLMTAPNVAAL